MVLDNFLPMCGKDEDTFRRVDVGAGRDLTVGAVPAPCRPDQPGPGDISPSAAASRAAAEPPSQSRPSW